MKIEEVMKSIQEVGDAFHELKKELPGLLKEHVDPLLKEKEEKLTAAMDEHEKKLEGLEELEKDIAQLKLTGDYQEKQEEEEDKAVSRLMVKFMKNQELSTEDHAMVRRCKERWVKKDQIAGNDSEGGFTVVPFFTGQITQRIFETSPMRQLASVGTIGVGEWIDWYDDSDVGDEEVAETEARSDTVGVLLNEIRIRTFTRAARIPVSVELLEDASINWDTYLQGKITNKFSRQENRDYISGNGVKVPRGIYDYDASPANDPGKFNTLERVSIPDVTLVGMIDIIDSLFDEFQSNSNLMMRRQTRSILRKLLDADGRPLWEPSLQRGTPPTWMGIPVLTAVHADLAQDSGGSPISGARPIIFGDFREGYQIVDRLGIRVIRDEITDDRFVKFRFRRRTGGGVKQFQAIKVGEVA